MAMTKCKECAADVSTKAETCPKCGAKMPRRTSWIAWLMAGVFAVAGVKCVMGENEAADKRAAKANAAAAAEAALSPAERASAAAAREAASAAAAIENHRWAVQVDRARLAVATLKASAKDPESFKLTQALDMPSGAICIEYRAKNSYGAELPGSAVAASGAKGVSTAAAEILKHCKGSGRRLTSAL